MFQNVPPLVGHGYHRAAAAALLAVFAMHDVVTHRFDNGLTLHVAGGHPAPVVAIQAWVGVGSADETATQAGVARGVGDMLFKGGAPRGAGELAPAVAGSGGGMTTWTPFEYTVYHDTL